MHDITKSQKDWLPAPRTKHRSPSASFRTSCDGPSPWSHTSPEQPLIPSGLNLSYQSTVENLNHLTSIQGIALELGGTSGLWLGQKPSNQLLDRTNKDTGIHHALHTHLKVTHLVIGPKPTRLHGSPHPKLHDPRFEAEPTSSLNTQVVLLVPCWTKSSFWTEAHPRLVL